MKNLLALFLQRLENEADTIQFSDSIDIIEQCYNYKPSGFSIAQSTQQGSVENNAGENEGSCKLIAFAQLNKLDTQKTLHLFGDFYRKDVLQHPTSSDHGNIRVLMELGVDTISFDSPPLTLIKI